MGDCDIRLEKVSNPPTETWRIAPYPYNLDGKCTIEVTAHGTLVTGIGQYGPVHITGWTAINGTVVFEPPPTQGIIEWNVKCPNCTKKLSHDFSPARQLEGCGKRLKLIADALGKIGRLRPGR